ncbi:MAG TPA: VTT domain-containing protein, partial [Polyangia bacterium]|nr:VTT domain-containing protein [Polyangia bacterium]
RIPVHRSLRGWVALVVTLLVLAAVWRFTPLRGLLHIDRITALGRRLAAHPAAPVWVLGGYLVGGVILFPITVLLGATALVFSPLPAIAYCLTGTLASAALTYWIGRLIGHFRAGWLRGPRLTRFEHQIRKRGMLAIVAARLLPVGNFSVINMAAGAFGIGFGDYMLGNLVGVLPGTLALTLFADRLGSTLRHPRGTNLVTLAAVALGLVAVLSWIRRRLARHA